MLRSVLPALALTTRATNLHQVMAKAAEAATKMNWMILALALLTVVLMAPISKQALRKKTLKVVARLAMVWLKG